jgi:hypothetical protein
MPKKLQNNPQLIALLVFAALTVAVMLPLYKSGHIFLLDMTWGPAIDLADYMSSGVGPAFPLTLLLKLLSLVFSVALIQKIVLTLILFLSGWLMYRLAKSLKVETLQRSNLYATLSGTIYMINPWVYERLLAGHWLVLLGYAVFPLLIKLFLKWREQLSIKSFIPLAILVSIYPILSPHWFYISTLFLLILFIISILTRNPSQPPLILRGGAKKVIFVTLLFFTFFVLINSFWLTSFFSESATFTGISLGDFQAYQTQADATFGPFINGLSLYGFWSTDFALPKDTLVFWWIYPLVLLGLSALGLYSLLSKERSLAAGVSGRTERFLGLSLLIIFPIALLLGVGFANEFTRSITTALYHILPGFKGLRETAKLFGLLSFCYALLVPLGAGRLAAMLSRLPSHFSQKALHMAMWLVVAVLVVAMSHSMFWGFAGQLKPADYPAGWFAVEDRLNSHPTVQTVLFLPWHGYMAMSFANYRTIHNPAPGFFSPAITAGKNIDNVFLKETAQPEWDDFLFRTLHGYATLDENIDFLQRKKISHVILAHEADWDRYGFLDEAVYLQKIFSDDNITLYAIGP